MTDSMGRVFHALGSPVRRQILDILKENPGSNVNDVSDYFEISRIAVMKHLKVLEEAELVISEKEGRDRRLYFNVVPIQSIYDRWTTKYSSLWAGSLTRLKYKVESEEKK